MSSRLGSADKGVKFNGGSKRRAVSPPSFSNIKRPKTVGGFVMDSDDDSGVEEDDPIKACRNDEDAIPAAFVPHLKQALPDPRTVEPSTTSVPTKNLNRYRLHMLLGRDNKAKSPSKHGTQSDAAVKKPPNATKKWASGEGKTPPISSRQHMMNGSAKDASLRRSTEPRSDGTSTGDSAATKSIGALSRYPGQVEQNSQADPKDSEEPTTTPTAATKSLMQREMLAMNANNTHGHLDDKMQGDTSQGGAPRSFLHALLNDAKDLELPADGVKQIHGGRNIPKQPLSTSQTGHQNSGSAASSDVSHQRRTLVQSTFAKPAASDLVPKTQTRKLGDTPTKADDNPAAAEKLCADSRALTSRQVRQTQAVPNSDTLLKANPARERNMPATSFSVPRPTVYTAAAYNDKKSTTTQPGKISQSSSGAAESMITQRISTKAPMAMGRLASAEQNKAHASNITHGKTVANTTSTLDITNPTLIDSSSNDSSSGSALAMDPPQNTASSPPHTAVDPRTAHKIASNALPRSTNSLGERFLDSATAKPSKHYHEHSQPGSVQSTNNKQSSFLPTPSTNGTSQSSSPPTDRDITLHPASKSSTRHDQTLEKPRLAHHREEGGNATNTHGRTTPSISRGVGRSAAMGIPSEVAIQAQTLSKKSTTQSTGLPPLTKPSSASIAVDPKSNIKAGASSLMRPNKSKISTEAEPYFEYSIFRKMWNGGQNEETATSTEITVRPFTSIDEANSQAEKMFQLSQETMPNSILAEWSNSRDEHDCSIFLGTFAPFDYPSQRSHFKVWVQRNFVSKFANKTPQSFERTSFISSACYILRLFKIDCESYSDSSNSSDSEDESEKSEPAIRTYHPHSFPEIYTTLEAANRAACRLHIELSHQKDPKDATTKAWQEQRLRELNAKLAELESLAGGEEGHWGSTFNACGLGGDKLELIVEKAKICGPRNL